jgi:hypothetical protein
MKFWITLLLPAWMLGFLPVAAHAAELAQETLWKNRMEVVATQDKCAPAVADIKTTFSRQLALDKMSTVMVGPAK